MLLNSVIQLVPECKFLGGEGGLEPGGMSPLSPSLYDTLPILFPTYTYHNHTNLYMYNEPHCKDFYAQLPLLRVRV